MTEDKMPENPIRRFIISPQIFAVIKSSLMDPEIEEMPTDYLRGLDFKIVKGQKGGWADYSTSGWARKESALTEAEQAAIAQHGLFNLKEFLPKKPSESELKIIKEMFEASVDGRPYDVDRWGAYYKPWGLDAGNSGRRDDEEYVAPARSAAPVPASQAKTEDTTAPWDTEETVAVQEVKIPAQAPVSSEKANDILAMIRSRQKTA
jgi:hypothetical protein